jgi:hypothetical protein
MQAYLDLFDPAVVYGSVRQMVYVAQSIGLGWLKSVTGMLR